jgi:hypothetical protein
MRFGIGVMTRNRFDYLYKCMKTLLELNPRIDTRKMAYGQNDLDTLDYPIIIGDDASDYKIIEKTRDTFYGCDILHFRKQRGMSANIKQVFDFAEAYLNLDYLFFTVNDYYCTREIDFPALLQFMENNPKVGQIQFVHWKGEIGDKRRERAAFNWTTKAPVDIGKYVRVGKERIRKTNYSYVNLPSITRLHQTDITRGTIERERGAGESADKYIQNIELRWVKNWYDTGLENWEIDPDTQPFLGMDIDITNRTEGIKA